MGGREGGHRKKEVEGKEEREEIGEETGRGSFFLRGLTEGKL
jgi:hypothetical protein